MGEPEHQSRLIFDDGLGVFEAPENHRWRDSRDGAYVVGITNDHSNYMQRGKRGSIRKWENRSLKVDLSLTMGWLPLRLRKTIGGGIPGMEPMFFGITNDHSNYMQRGKRGSIRKWENRSLKVDLSLTMGWLPLRPRKTIGGGISRMEPMFFGITNDLT